MIYIPIVALILGVVLGFLIKVPVTGIAGVYMGVAVVAGLDSVFGGLRSAIEGKFRSDVFMTGFVANIVIAFFLAWFGDRIGVNVYFVAILVTATTVPTLKGFNRVTGELPRINSALNGTSTTGLTTALPTQALLNTGANQVPWAALK